MLKTITFTPAVGSAITLHNSSGGAYQVTRAEGIIGTPATRDVEKIAPGRDGVLSDTRFVDGRSIVLEGEIFGTSTSDTLTKWDTISSALQTTLFSRGTLTVTRDDNTARQCEVILTGAAQPSIEGGSPFLNYQINLRAPDPRWYGTTLNTSTISYAPTPAGTWASGNYPAGRVVTQTISGTTYTWISYRAAVAGVDSPSTNFAVNPYGGGTVGDPPATWQLVKSVNGATVHTYLSTLWSTSSTITNAGTAPTPFTVANTSTVNNDTNLFRVSITPPTGYLSATRNGTDFQILNRTAGLIDAGSVDYTGGTGYDDIYGGTGSQNTQLRMDNLNTGLQSVNTTNRTTTATGYQYGISASTEWPSLYPGANVWKWASNTPSNWAATGTNTAISKTITWRDAWW